jgi:hypothetical protein
MHDLQQTLVLAAFGIFGGALTVGAWLPRRRGTADWLMGIGATVAAISFGAFGSALSLFDSNQLKQGLLFAGEGGMGTGALLFSMGFLMNRMEQRRREGHPVGQERS